MVRVGKVVRLDLEAGGRELLEIGLNMARSLPPVGCGAGAGEREEQTATFARCTSQLNAVR